VLPGEGLGQFGWWSRLAQAGRASLDWSHAVGMPVVPGAVTDSGVCGDDATDNGGEA
jgi:hypothetical protein